jgi:hypothetical protein
MKNLLALVVLISVGTADLFAQNLPSHCADNNNYRQALQGIGPVIAVGASGSSGLLATPFPLLVAGQMCLQQGSGFESRYSIFFFGAKLSFLKKMYTEQRPKVVIAIDHLHHSSKGRKFNSATREYIDRELARIALDCRHSIVDCSAQGDFHFVEQENYKPIVLLGDIFAFYAVDCSKTNPFKQEKVEERSKGCIDDYIKINQYMRQKANEIPNLHLFPVNRFFKHLHRGLPYLYDLDGKLGSFYKEDLFWDGFHPWSEPGAQVMANIILVKLNELILNKSLPAKLTIPYIPIADEYYEPFTGIVLIDDTKTGIPPEKKRRFITPQGDEFRFAFTDKTKSFRNDNGDWEYLEVFAKGAKSSVARVGNNPLVMKIEQLTQNGDIILADDQISWLQKVSENPDNQLLGGVITVAE